MTKRSNFLKNNITIYHEIGHFISEYKITGNVASISTERYGQVRGHVYVEEETIEIGPVTRDQLNKKLITLLGGLAGEEVMYGDVTSGAKGDVGLAREYIRSLLDVGAFGFDKMNGLYRVGRLNSNQAPMSNERVKAIEDIECSLLTEAYEKAKELISSNTNLAKVLYQELKQKQKLSKREVEIILEEFNRNVAVNTIN